MEVTTIGIDLAKSVFAVSAADGSGRLVIRRQLRRAQMLGFMRELPRSVVGMEATGGAQYWARQLTALGHEVRLMSPSLVMPYRKGNKTDRNDADAILEAVTRPSMGSSRSRAWRSRICSRCTGCGRSWSRAAPPCATSCAAYCASAEWWCGPAWRR
jgi:transposase